jgi:hypothetical protein
MAPPGHHISDVLGLRSWRHMPIVHASRRVAGVAQHGAVRDRTHSHLVAEAMGKHLRSPDLDDAVSLGIRSSGPQHTSGGGRRYNEFPKPLHRRPLWAAGFVQWPESPTRAPLAGVPSAEVTFRGDVRAPGKGARMAGVATLARLAEGPKCAAIPCLLVVTIAEVARVERTTTPLKGANRVTVRWHRGLQISSWCRGRRDGSPPASRM